VSTNIPKRSGFNVLAMVKLQKSGFSFDMDSLSKLNVLLLVLGVALMLATLQLARTWWHLRYIPGPFLGSITNFQRVWWVTTKRAHLIHQEMHEKYGEVVRTGPNTVMFSNPEVIQTVYTMRPGFVKVRVFRLAATAEHRR